jgi:hypothetical protein
MSGGIKRKFSGFFFPSAYNAVSSFTSSVSGSGQPYISFVSFFPNPVSFLSPQGSHFYTKINGKKRNTATPILLSCV